MLMFFYGLFMSGLIGFSTGRGLYLMGLPEGVYIDLAAAVFLFCLALFSMISRIYEAVKK
jgi:hypothetical protein